MEPNRPVSINSSFADSTGWFIELRDAQDFVIIQAFVNSMPGQYLSDL